MITLYAPEEAFYFLTLAEGHDGLLPVGRLADVARACAPPRAPLLAAHRHRVDVPDLDALGLVLLLERLLDLGLGRGREHLEGVATLRVEQVRALGDDRADHDLAGGLSRHSRCSFRASARSSLR